MHCPNHLSQTHRDIVINYYFIRLKLYDVLTISHVLRNVIIFCMGKKYHKLFYKIFLNKWQGKDKLKN